ncbi:MAG: HTTM domain-containing protein [Flavobacteriaceae bacterium]|nr:HTTM domain-containing protein [Flavobacteriaceae bacterium]
MEKFLFRHIDNTPLIVFRIIFGLLLFLESVGAIFTGWVTRTLIEPTFTFNFIGFEFLQPLPGNGMYYYYLIMGVFGFCVMIGYRYRLAIISFFILWSATYLMQKSSYNNHYYLVCLLSFLMIFQPANNYLSIDVKRNPELKSTSVPFWTSLLLILQIGLVYFYGGIAKIYPDWLNADPVRIFLSSKADYPLVGSLFTKEWFHYFLSYSGLFFDLLIVPLLLFKKTRIFGFSLSIFFHLFNAIIFQIGIFPFLSLSFALFFFEPQTIRNIFLKKKSFYENNEVILPQRKNYYYLLIGIYFAIQLLLPLRHWFIKDNNVLWTEEGHRLSWRMMLRSKNGYQIFTVIDKTTNKKETIKLTDYLTQKQIGAMSTKPDMIWQFAQHLKKEYSIKGKNIAIFVKGKVSVNGKSYQPLVKDTIDLASVKWNHFKHSEWLLPYKK